MSLLNQLNNNIKTYIKISPLIGERFIYSYCKGLPIYCEIEDLCIMNIKYLKHEISVSRKFEADYTHEQITKWLKVLLNGK